MAKSKWTHEHHSHMWVLPKPSVPQVCGMPLYVVTLGFPWLHPAPPQTSMSEFTLALALLAEWTEIPTTTLPKPHVLLKHPSVLSNYWYHANRYQCITHSLSLTLGTSWFRVHLLYFCFRIIWKPALKTTMKKNSYTLLTSRNEVFKYTNYKQPQAQRPLRVEDGMDCILEDDWLL